MENWFPTLTDKNWFDLTNLVKANFRSILVGMLKFNELHFRLKIGRLQKINFLTTKFVQLIFGNQKNCQIFFEYAFKVV